MSKSSKKGGYGKTEGGSTSKGRAAPKVNKDDEDLARKLNEELNAGFLEDLHSTDQGQSTSGNPKEIREAIDFVQGYAEDVLNTCCHGCDRRLIRNIEVKDWIRKWKAVQNTGSSTAASGYTCECGVTTCLGCGLEVRVGDARYMAEYDGQKLDYCCSKGGVFVAMIVLCRYDYMELVLQERSRHNEATAKRNKQILGRYYATNDLPGTGTGYDAHTMNPFLAVPGHSAVDATEGYRRRGLQQALNFRQVDAETDKATMQILGMLIELLPKRGDTTKKVSPVMSSMIELSLLQDRVAELLRNDSLQDVNNRAALYFAAFELVTRLGHHSMLDYLVREDRFKKKQSAGLHAIAIAGHSSKGKGKGKSDEQEALVVANRSEGPLAPSLLSCMNNLATQSRVLLGASNKTAAGNDIVEIAKRIKNVYKGLIGEEKATVATITTWKEYHRANCLSRKPNIARHLCSTMAATASQVYNPDKGRMGRLITEATEMTTSLPEGIFVLVDEVRPDIMKALIVGPKDTPYEGGLFEFDIVCGPHYPAAPPSVWFLTTGRGSVGFNPNLYPTGKVCLSLIGTWEGSPESRWQPGKSTIMSVLVSIQSMILWQWPFENEPNYENAHLSGDPVLMAKCEEYNRRVRGITMRFAMLDWLTRREMREGVWGEVLRGYWRFCGRGVVERARGWEEEIMGMWLKGKGLVGRLEAEVEKIVKA